MADPQEDRPARRLRVPGAEIPVAPIVRDAEFDGLLVLQGPAQIDGRISGEILSDETVWIGKDAQINANITALNVVVAGNVQGEIRADGRIALESTAKVKGELSAQRLVLIEGSHLEGSCHAGDTSTKGS